MKNYFIHIQGWAHSMNAYGTSKADALKRFKHQHGMLRMPKGFAIWEA